MFVPGSQFQVVGMQASAGATGNGTAVEMTSGEMGSYVWITMQVEGISGDTVTFEATVDDSTWYGILAENLTSGTAATTATADGLYRVNGASVSQVRARISTYSAGTIDVTGYAVA